MIHCRLQYADTSGADPVCSFAQNTGSPPLLSVGIKYKKCIEYLKFKIVKFM